MDACTHRTHASFNNCSHSWDNTMQVCVFWHCHWFNTSLNLYWKEYIPFYLKIFPRLVFWCLWPQHTLYITLKSPISIQLGWDMLAMTGIAYDFRFFILIKPFSDPPLYPLDGGEVIREETTLFRIKMFHHGISSLEGYKSEEVYIDFQSCFPLRGSKPWLQKSMCTTV